MKANLLMYDNERLRRNEVKKESIVRQNTVEKLDLSFRIINIMKSLDPQVVQE